MTFELLRLSDQDNSYSDLEGGNEVYTKKDEFSLDNTAVAERKICVEYNWVIIERSNALGKSGIYFYKNSNQWNLPKAEFLNLD